MNELEVLILKRPGQLFKGVERTLDPEASKFYGIRIWKYVGWKKKVLSVTFTDVYAERRRKFEIENKYV